AVDRIVSRRHPPRVHDLCGEGSPQLNAPQRDVAIIQLGHFGGLLRRALSEGRVALAPHTGRFRDSVRRNFPRRLVICNGAPGRSLEIIILPALERPEKSEQADEPEAERQRHENYHDFHHDLPCATRRARSAITGANGLPRKTRSAVAWLRCAALIGDIETCAAASAGASFSPSPTIITLKPSRFRSSMRAILSAGVPPARHSLTPSARAAAR